MYYLLIWFLAAIIISIHRHFEEIEQYKEKHKEKYSEEIYYNSIEEEFENTTIHI